MIHGFVRQKKPFILIERSFAQKNYPQRCSILWKSLSEGLHLPY